MKYHAHSPKKDIPAQSYEDHINCVRTLARDFAKAISGYAKYDGALLAETAYLSSTFHDLGKLDEENQKVLSGEITSKHLPNDHIEAGTAYFLDDRHLSAISAAVVKAHHSGFPDFVEEQANKNEQHMFRDLNLMAEIDDAWPALESIHNSLISGKILPKVEEIKGDRSVFLRLLLSCVADADHTDTARHYKRFPDHRQIIPLRPLERLLGLDAYVAEKNKSPSDQRNALRDEMYHACKNAKIDSPIVSCESPVGSGKTTAIMAHLLKQADARQLRRIFVVLPYTNIIKQSVRTYRCSLCLAGENPEDVVGELHHRADFQNYDARHYTALWRSPIIVTTAVAFFETLASNSPATLRRLHELPGSAIFVDESHAALPIRFWPLAWKWMNIFAREWGCHWVLASGSLNKFWTIKDLSDNTTSTHSEPVPELVDDQLRMKLAKYEKARIIYRCDLKPKTLESWADWIVGFKGPRLAILNTVQSAAVAAGYFSTHFGPNCVEHLSTALTPIDRDKTFQRIEERLESATDTDWTLIATSCIEAGVNFSFRIGFRELSSLMSLLQIAGRINREGIYEDSEVWTFCLNEGQMLKNNPSLAESISILRRYFERHVDIAHDLTTKSIEDELKIYGVSSKIKTLLNYELNQRFPLVERNFNVIDSDTRLAVVEQEIAEKIGNNKMDWQELQKHSVQIAKYKLDELRTPEIKKNIYWWNLKYDNFLGYMAGIIEAKKLSNGVLII